MIPRYSKNVNCSLVSCIKSSDEKSISYCFPGLKKKKLCFFPPNLYQNTCLWVCRQFERIGGHRQSLSPNNWFWFWPGPLAFSPFIKLRLAGKSWYHFVWSRGDSCLIIGARYFSVAAFSSFSVLLFYIHVKVSLLYLMQF